MVDARDIAVELSTPAIIYKYFTHCVLPPLVDARDDAVEFTPAIYLCVNFCCRLN